MKYLIRLTETSTFVKEVEVHGDNPELAEAKAIKDIGIEHDISEEEDTFQSSFLEAKVIKVI